MEELINDQVRQEKIKYLAQQADENWRLEKERLELEHKIKLERELKAAKEPIPEVKEDDPWKRAESVDEPELANLTPRR